VRFWLVLVCLYRTAVAGSAPDLALQRGKVLLASGDETAAILTFDELIERFPASPRAAEAAMLVLDVLNGRHRFDDLLTHVDHFVHDRPLLRHRAFARDLRRVYLRCCLRRDVAPPPTDYEREALDRLEEFASNPTGAYSDELLYQAGWQFCVANHPGEAARAWRVLLALFPQSDLVRRAQIGLGDLETCAHWRE
jgi:hypothetical protein